METTERIELEWKYRCTARSLDSVPREVLDSSRIYLWIYRNAAASRIAYVGKSTGFSFKKRFREHFQVLFGCGYAVYQITEEEDYLDFLATNVVGKKVDQILTQENICWYQPWQRPGYFKATFFENTEKRRRILDHYLAHLEFAFAPLQSPRTRRPRRGNACTKHS